MADGRFYGRPLHQVSSLCLPFVLPVKLVYLDVRHVLPSVGVPVRPTALPSIPPRSPNVHRRFTPLSRFRYVRGDLPQRYP